MTQFSLQLFADAGTVVNGTGGYADAYTGAQTGFAGGNDLSAAMKTYYDTELLENARPELVHTQFGRRVPLPAGRGKTVEWRKWNTLADASALTEGVIPTGQKFGQSAVTQTIGQYGTYVSVSDQLELHAIDDVILGAAEELGASAGSTEDKLVRNALAQGTNVQYAHKVSGGTHTAVASRAALDATALLTPDEVNRAVTWLKKLKAPRIDGKYVAIIHPSAAYDLRSCDEWVDAHKYAAPDALFTGEIGELHGVRFVETTEAKIFRGADLASDGRNLTVNGAVSDSATVAFDGGTVAEDALIGRAVLIGTTVATVTDNTASSLTLDRAVTAADNAVIYPGEGGSAGLAVYGTLFLGRDAYGLIDPEGAGMEMIIHDKSQVGGPLNQFSTLGYKVSQAARILYQDRMVRVESCSAYSAADGAN